MGGGTGGAGGEDGHGSAALADAVGLGGVGDVDLMETGVEHGRSLPPWPRSSEGGDWRLVVRNATFGVRGAAPRGVVDSAMPARITAPPASCSGPNGIAEGQRAGGGADQRLEVQERARELGRDPRLPVGEQRERQQRARDRRARPGRSPARPRPARAAGPRATAFGTAASPPAIICTAVTAIGSRPRSSDGWTTTNVADSVTDSSTSASPSVDAPPPPPPATIPTPASASAKPSQAAGPVELRPSAAAISATSTGTAPTISAAWLTLVLSMPAFWSTITSAVADRAGEQDRGVIAARRLRRATSASSGAASAKRATVSQPPGEPVQDELGQRDGEPPQEAGGDERDESGMTASDRHDTSIVGVIRMKLCGFLGSALRRNILSSYGDLT